MGLSFVGMTEESIDILAMSSIASMIIPPPYFKQWGGIQSGPGPDLVDSPDIVFFRNSLSIYISWIPDSRLSSLCRESINPESFNEYITILIN